ncbi:hypothetical protein NQ315_013595 [Exocentrus adspersus]|uniref:Fatty acyl-CoA reductase n=1 Tax=Exocentrus adspersus TaxID=1586481 RepID=A0AAV8W4X5_9CUCU|nr:hypothetical protein NQ315_013595 [Exocentrus adspersus]
MESGSVEFSEIQHFYSNTTVFLTGATGFIGKLLLEKLLRQCHVKHVYILVRYKDGVKAEIRCAEIFDAVIFDSLRRKDPEFFKRVSLIEGDCEKPNLGISEDDKVLLIKEVNCIFHCTSDNKFDSGLKEATDVNVRSTRDLVDLAKEVENLKSFVYLSTIFSNFPKFEIHEEIHEPNITTEQLINVVDGLDNKSLSLLQPELLKDWPTASTYTKHVAEGLLKEEGHEIPISIVRASHVIAVAEEPVAGYVENLCSLSGLAVANALGVNRVNYYKNGTLDVIPGDYVVSLLVASGWYAGLQKIRKKRGDIGTTDTLVYHCISSQEKPITSDEWMGVTETSCREVPSTKMIRLPLTFNTACYYNYRLLTFLLNTCMGFLCDTCLQLLGKYSNIVDGFKKFHKLQELASPFLMRQWYVSNDNTQKLLKRMSFKDRELFNFDVLTINWELYFPNFARGLRVYVMKDPMSTLGEGRSKLRMKLYAMLLTTAVLVVVLYVISRFIIFKVLFR